MLPISDTTMAAAEYALRGLSLRADVSANNLANVNTPRFRAGRVDFEAQLRAALDAGVRPEQVNAPAVLPGMGLPDALGNTVSMEEEMVGMMKTNLLRDAMVNAYNNKVTVLRTAIRGQ